MELNPDEVNIVRLLEANNGSYSIGSIARQSRVSTDEVKRVISRLVFNDVVTVNTKEEKIYLV